MLLPPPIVRRFVWTSWLPVFDFLRAISILPTDSWQSLPPRTCLAVHNFCGAPLRFEESLGLQWFGGETSRDKGRGKESTAVVQRSTGWETNTQQGKARSSCTPEQEHHGTPVEKIKETRVRNTITVLHLHSRANSPALSSAESSSKDIVVFLEVSVAAF